MERQIRDILAANLLIVFIGLTVAYVMGTDSQILPVIDEAYCYSLMTIAVAFVTFFGFLCLPGGREDDGTFSASRIRFSITVTLVLVCVVYFATTGYWDSSESYSKYAELMVPVLSHVLILTLAFYFGATALKEVLSSRKDTPPS